MFEQLFGDFSLPARAIVALVLVLILIALVVWLLRRFGDGGLASSAGGRGRQQRLAVLDSAQVDARRKLVLIRRDNIEHLILIGGPTDVVVEPNIVRAQPAGGVRPASRPGTFEDDEMSLVPDALLPEPEPAPAPVRSAPPAPAAAPSRPTPPAATEPARVMPRPATKVDPQYADMAQRLEAALRKPSPEPEVAARTAPAATPPAPTPRAPEAPRAPAPEPRILDQRARAPMPRIPEAGPRPEPRAPEVRPSAPAPRPSGDQSAADVFVSLEEEMASLLRPGGKKDPNK
jgi:hypothetical protein